MGRLVRSTALALAALVLGAGSSLTLAQAATEAPGATVAEGAAPAAAPAPAPWGSQCSGAGRSLPMDCTMEQRIVLTETGQLLTGVTIRVPGDTRSPVIMIHAPIGLFLPAGLQLLVDNAPIEKMDLQTCDNGGCYAGSPVSDALLAALKAGATLSIVFQDLSKKDISVPVPLVGFTATYESIR